MNRHKIVPLTAFCLLAVPTASAQTQVSENWVARIKGTPNFSSPVAIASDSLGNVYVTGTFTPPSPDTHTETLTVKYDNAGKLLWKTWFGSTAHNSQSGAIGLDGSGNVYIAARIALNGNNEPELATIKYDTNGARKWVNYIAPVSGGGNIPIKMIVTPTGDVYVAAFLFSPNFTSQALTVKYDTTGTQAWLRRNPTPAVGSNTPSGLGLDSSENVYLAVNSSHFYPTVYKFDRDGNSLGSFNSPAFYGSFNVFTVDAQGNSYAGECYTPGPLVGKFDAQGNQLWLDHLAPTRCFSDITLDTTQGNVILAETVSANSGTASNIAVLKLNGAGAQQWEKQFNGQANNSGADFATTVATDPQDNVYVLGATEANPRLNVQPQGDLVTIKYSQDGEQIWLQRFGNQTRIVMFSRAMLRKVDGDIVVTGESEDLSGLPNSSNDWVTIDYHEVPGP